MEKQRYSHWLVLGILSFLFVVGWHVLEPISNAVPVFFYSMVLVCTLAFHFLFYRAVVQEQRFRSVDHLLTVATITGILAFSSTLMADLSKQLMSGPWQHRAFSELIDLARFYVVLSYLLFLLFLFKKLFFYQKRRVVLLLWRLFSLLTITASLSSLQGYEAPMVVLRLALAVGVLLAFGLALQIKWIAFQDRANHWVSIGLLSVIVLVVFGLGQQLRRLDLPFVLQGEPGLDLFISLIISLLLIYGIFSILALFFNLPISSVMEDKDSEIKSYQELHNMILSNDSPEDVFKKLFAVCMSNTSSDGGWLQLQEHGVKRVEQLDNLQEGEVAMLGLKLRLDQRLSIDSAKDHLYFPKLSRSKLKGNTRLLNQFGSLLIYPIIVQGNMLGKIGLLKVFNDGFDDYMIGMGKSYIQQSKVLYENVSLLKEKIDADLNKEQMKVARSVQKGLLPTDFPTSKYVSISAFSESALEVGGDYYDFHQIDESRFAFVIGDVSGKGTSAAFHMAELKGIFQSLIQLDLAPEEFMKLANQSVNNCVKTGLFITFTFVLMDFKTGRGVYSRAGHCPLLIFCESTGEARYLKDEGIAFGIMESEDFVQHQQIYDLHLNSGDVILLYTDGITEGRNATTGEAYDGERLRQVLHRNRHLDSSSICSRIYNSFKIFTEGDEHRDDASLMVIKVL